MTWWSTTKCHIQTIMTDEFSWAWNAPDSVNKVFPLFLKKLFHLKNRPVFMKHLYNYQCLLKFRTGMRRYR